MALTCEFVSLYILYTFLLAKMNCMCILVIKSRQEKEAQLK